MVPKSICSKTTFSSTSSARRAALNNCKKWRDCLPSTTYQISSGLLFIFLSKIVAKSVVSYETDPLDLININGGTGALSSSCSTSIIFAPSLSFRIFLLSHISFSLSKYSISSLSPFHISKHVFSLSYVSFISFLDISTILFHKS